MDRPQQIQQNVGQQEVDTKIETHCYLCQEGLPDGLPVISSKCGVYYHEDCARRSVTCPACGENLLEHFLSQEARKKIVKKDRIYTILMFLIPFVLVELLIALWSMMNHPSRWSILPWFGEAFILDLVILIVGILIAVVIFAKLGYKPEKTTINAIVLQQKGPTPQMPDQQLYACGYGERISPIQLGDISIPNKAGVQRENVIRVSVDRLSMTPDQTFVWLNPRFMKVLPAKDNPQPSSLQELDAVWKATGKTKIAPSEEKAEKEEKYCSTCGKPLEYIAEYDAWYCSSCGKYEEEEGKEIPEDLPPPPEGESPHPKDDTPPPPEEL
ncbi:MAG: hypothetical protein JSW00_15985 [Thermoplasmata archaeon]|nr:MAG: hypothetical protein JSW00_15985 [Thermoplasmata archaeon]